ncbi:MULTISPECIES: hypothetical protein [Pseudanabaena]|uniref:Uncharacterized protein n=2 Tax=Pseudanabaena TaxID=1152 RepID=A0A9X4M5P2_9CYAN|nr:MULTISPECIES: hypothetical protein [Pseudanabaena]MDG3494241.1 hypothetical protein [Pseudanabaena catenata USMAC16]
MRENKKGNVAMLINRQFKFLAISLLSAILILVGCQSNLSSSSNKGGIGSDGSKNIPSTSLPAESIKADLGFRPAANGFSFENYGKDSNIKNLSPSEMQRMFGNSICATQGESCILTPPAQQWMEEVNKSMNGGHCEGMAALSLILYADKDKASGFGNIPDLSLQGNEKLQHEIAYWFATQYVPPTATSEIRGKAPSEILDTLLTSMKPNARIDDTYTMGIYQPGFKGGHAITPYAVGDLGDGKYVVMVYDNNHPQIERRIEIDRKANTWKYNAATNPDEPEAQYIGDAETKTLTLTPTPPRYERQVCNFCGLDEQASANSSDKTTAKGNTNGNANGNAAPKFNQIFLEGDADLLITNGDQKIGYENGKFVNSFSGATFTPIKSSELWQDDEEPIYNIPTGVPFTMTLQGNKKSDGKELTDVAMIGPSYDLGLSGIKVLSGQKDVIQFDASGRSLSYQPSNSEAPNIFFGISTKNDDYEFELDGVEIDAGGTISANLDTAKGRLGIKIAETKHKAVFNLLIGRIDDKTEQKFEGEDLDLASGDTLYLDYAKWTGNGAKLTIELDKGSDGTIDDTATLEDKKK